MPPVMAVPMLSVLLTGAQSVLPYEVPADLDELESWRDIGALDARQAEHLAAWLTDPVDINRASRAALAALPGMTPELADRVIAQRPFTNVDAFVALPDLPEGLGESLRPLLRVAPAEIWRGAAGAAWSVHAGGTPFLLAGAADGSTWAAQVQLQVPPERRGREATTSAGRGVSGSTQGASAGGALPARAGWDRTLLGMPLRLTDVYATAQQQRARFVVGDFTAGFAEGATLDLSHRVAPQGLYRRGPSRFMLARGHWHTPGGLTGVAARWEGDSLEATGVAAMLPAPLAAGALVLNCSPAWRVTWVGLLGAPLPSAPPSETGYLGAVGLATQWDEGPWSAGAEGSRAFPAGWAWRLRLQRSLGTRTWVAVRQRGATADSSNPYRHGGRRGPWYEDAGTRLQLRLQERGWGAQSTADGCLARRRWRLGQQAWWAWGPAEKLRLGLGLGAGGGKSGHGGPSLHDSAQDASGSTDDAPVPWRWSARLTLTSSRWRRWPWSLSASAAATRWRLGLRLAWHAWEESVLSLGLGTAGELSLGGNTTPQPRAARDSTAYVAVDMRHGWEGWQVQGRWWCGARDGWEHGALVQVAFGY